MKTPHVKTPHVKTPHVVIHKEWVVICVKSIVLFDYSVRGGKYRQL